MSGRDDTVDVWNDVTSLTLPVTREARYRLADHDGCAPLWRSVAFPACLPWLAQLCWLAVVKVAVWLLFESPLLYGTAMVLTIMSIKVPRILRSSFCREISASQKTVMAPCYHKHETAKLKLREILLTSPTPKFVNDYYQKIKGYYSEHRCALPWVHFLMASEVTKLKATVPELTRTVLSFGAI